LLITQKVSRETLRQVPHWPDEWRVACAKPGKIKAPREFSSPGWSLGERDRQNRV